MDVRLFVVLFLWYFSYDALCTPPLPVVMWHGMGMYGVFFQCQL